jgi:hypothetical protein
MTRDEQEAFRRLAGRPELRDLNKPEQFGPEIFYGMLTLSAELLGGGLWSLLAFDWKILVGTVIVLVSTLFVLVAIIVRRNA